MSYSIVLIHSVLSKEVNSQWSLQIVILVFLSIGILLTINDPRKVIPVVHTPFTRQEKCFSIQSFSTHLQNFNLPTRRRKINNFSTPFSNPKIKYIVLCCKAIIFPFFRFSLNVLRQFEFIVLTDIM